MNALRRVKSTAAHRTRGGGGVAAAAAPVSAPLPEALPPPPREPRLRPRPRPQLLQLGLPLTAAADVAAALAQSSRRQTAARADAKREAVAAALHARRPPAIAESVLAEYLPYVTACERIASGLRERGRDTPRRPVRWKSALAAGGAVDDEVSGGFDVDVAFVLFSHALAKLHAALLPEGRTLLAGGDSEALVATSRDLQLAAGMFRHVADVSIPLVLQRLESSPPPELDERVAGAMAGLALAVAQCLVVRHAELAGFPPASLAKLSLGARALCNAAAEQAEACGPALAPAVAATAKDFAVFMRAMSQRLLADDAAARLALGERAGRMRVAVRYMSSLAAGGMLGALAAERLEQYSEVLREAEEDARREIEPEPEESVLGTSRMETKVMVQASSYEPPVAEPVKKTSYS